MTPSRLTIGLITALIVMTTWAGVATYKYVQLKAVAPVKCSNEKLAENLKGVENALGVMSQQVQEASAFIGVETTKTNEVLVDLGKAFTPIEVALNEKAVVVPAGCTGVFPAGVRGALDKAVAEANG